MRGDIGAHLHTQGGRGHFACERFDAIPSLIQERDHLRTRLAEDLHGQGRFLCAIRHRLESIRQIQQHLGQHAVDALGGVGQATQAPLD